MGRSRGRAYRNYFTDSMGRLGLRRDKCYPRARIGPDAFDLSLSVLPAEHKGVTRGGSCVLMG